ncbi:MAG TPA: DoxX family protein [Terriglobales bacterium]|nr:DoxX family protein [Terriglobales bacterium]
MSYSYRRFRRVLAFVRIVLGMVFTYYGATKLFDPNFFSFGFNNTLTDLNRSAATWYSPIVESMWKHPSSYAVAIGMVELFIGLGLLFGLATRPVSFVGMLYSINKTLIAWQPNVQYPTTWNYLDAHMAQIALFCLFWIFLVEHAGETWGLGAIYHAHRFRLLPVSSPIMPQVTEEEENEQTSDSDENEIDTPLPRRPVGRRAV